jgi:hypothetical protein
MKPLDIYRLLEKSNCGDCRLPSCMAFAVSVVQGERPIEDCPYLDRATAARLAAEIRPIPSGAGFSAAIVSLKNDVSKMDFAAIAGKTGAGISDGNLLIKCLGRDFMIDASGNLISDCHVNIWLETILLNYCLASGGDLEGTWVPFENLRRCASAAPFFKRRCEDPLRLICDAHTDVFFELLEIFGSRKVDGFQEDYSVVVHPLPRVPFLITYRKREDGFESRLKVLFDGSAGSYLRPEVITLIGRGIVEMFQKIIPRHQEYASELRYL